MMPTRTQRGMALAIFLMLLPILAVMAWTFLKVGSTVRAEAVAEERRIRGLHAAEAGIRMYLVIGQGGQFELNGCEVDVSVLDGRIISKALPKGSIGPTTITLEVEKGFVSRRFTNDSF